MALVKSVMVQVGQMAMRAPDGSFLPAVPIFIRDSDVSRINDASPRPVLKDMGDTEFIKAFSDLFQKMEEHELMKEKGAI